MNLATAGPIEPRALAQGLPALMVGQCAAYAVLVVARLTLLRSARVRPLPLRTLLCFGVASLLGGIIGGAVTALSGSGGPASAAPPSSEVALLALVATLVSATLVLAVSAVIVDTWREYRSNSIALRAAQERIAQLRELRVGSVDAAVDAVRDQLAGSITERLDALDTTDSRNAAAEITTLVDEVVRPMSRELFVSPAAPDPASAGAVRPDYGAALRDATEPPLLLPVSLGAFTALLVFFSTLISQGASRALIVAGLSIVVTMAVAYAVNLAYAVVAPRLGGGGRLLAWLIAVGVLVTALMATWSVALARESSAFQVWALALAITVIAIMLTFAKLASTVTLRQESELAALPSVLAWEESRTRMTQWGARNALAEALHGPVQSALLSAALRLELSAVSPDPRAERADARAIVDDSMAAFARSVAHESDTLATLAALSRTWAPLCEVTWQVSEGAQEALAADDVAARAMSAVITEACSNSVRHGQATAIHIAVGLDPPRLLCVDVEDTGAARASANPGGGGTALLDAVALHWQRRVTSRGTVLSVVLPMTDEASAHA